MTNICKLDIQVEFGSFEQAQKLELELQSLIERNEHGSGFMHLDKMSLGYVYLRRCNHELTIEATVKCGTNDEEMISLLKWFQSRADVCTFEVLYEEVAGHLLGTYDYDDMEPEILWHHQLPEDKWIEDDGSDDWFDRLYDRLENESVDTMIKLKQGEE